MASDILGYASERTARLVLTAAVGIFVARYLGPRGFGLLSYAGGVYGLLAPFTLLGMQQILVREFSTTPRDWRSVLTSALGTQAPAAGAASVAAFTLIAVSRDFDHDAVLIAIMLSPVPLLGLSASVRSYLEAVGAVRRIVLTGLVAGLVASVAKVTGVLVQAPVWTFAAFTTLETAIVAVGLFGGLPERLRSKAARRHFQADTARSLLRESWPLLMAGLAITIYMKADLIMLGLLSGDFETGLYTSAARISEVWYFLPVSAAGAIRPRLARMYGDGNFDQYRVATQKFMSAAVGISLAAIVFVVVAANQLIGFLYGSEFLAASPVLRIHILSAPFVFLGVAGSQWFIDHGMTRDVMMRTTAGAVTNIGLNLALIPSIGALGASIATLVSYAASSVLLNAIGAGPRKVFWLQMKALLLYWPRFRNSDSSR